MPSYLLKDGTVLLHDVDDHVSAVRTDLLIEGNKITKIGVELSPDSSTEVIDCSGKLICPGFIDTHRHLWQTQLKGRHANELLLSYLETGNFAGSLFSPDDVFWGELGGALESIDAGTTTIVDHAHINYSPEHSTKAISALVASGVRGYFCYTANMRVKSWQPEFTFEEEAIPAWFVDQLHALSQEQPFGDGRVELGLAWDSWYLPKEVVSKIFEQARGWGIKLITTHHNRSPTLGFMSIQPLVEWNLLGSDVLFSHCVNATAEEAAQINHFGAHVSSTPSTEIQMALGDPVCFRTDLSKVSSLGVDCHSAAAADIPGQMRLALQYARGTRNRRIIESGKTPRSIEYTVEQVFNLGTIQGARAVGKESEIGSLAEGKLADLVIYDPQSPGMVCASALDPVAAIVLHSSVRDIDTVFVDGVIRKQGGKLSPVDVDSKKMDWKEIASKLVESYHKIQEEVEKCDYDKALKTICSTFMLSDSMYSD